MSWYLPRNGNGPFHPPCSPCSMPIIRRADRLASRLRCQPYLAGSNRATKSPLTDAAQPMPAHDLFFLLPADTTVLSLNISQYRALLLDQPQLRLPRFAHRRIRFAHLTRDFEDGPSLARAFRYWSFDGSGAVDRDAFFMPLFDAVARAREACRRGAPSTGNLIDARARFEIGFTSWVPSASCLAALRAFACGKTCAPSLESYLAAPPAPYPSEVLCQ